MAEALRNLETLQTGDAARSRPGFTLTLGYSRMMMAEATLDGAANASRGIPAARGSTGEIFYN
jgi:hypothetical protein